MARRSGERWFVGAITNEVARALDVSTAFLGGGNWRVQTFSDGTETVPTWKTPVVLSDQLLRAGDVLHLRLNSSGGEAILLAPAT